MGGLLVVAIAAVMLRRSRPSVAVASPATPADVPTAGPAFDLDKALALCGGDHAFLETILEQMPAEGTTQIAAIRAALASGDAAGVRLAAHRLKGALLIIAAAPAAEAALSLERAGAAGDLARSDALVGALAAELDRLHAVIAAPRTR